MTVNLVSQTSKYMTPDLMERLAAALGTDRKDLRQASRAAIPALLGSLANLASSREGARKIDAAVSQNGPDVLDNLPSSIGGGSRKEFADRGMRHLSNLFGSTTASALGNAVGKFSGLGQSTASSLVAMLTPMILGLLGKEKSLQNLDAAGIARLLREQKENVSAAMPSEFKKLLGTGGMSGLAGVSGEPPHAARQAVAGADRQRRRSSGNWLVWLVALLVIIGAGLWFLNTRTVERVDTRSTVVGGVELTSALRTSLNGVATALRGISDVESARAALPRLEAARAELAGIAELSERLPAEGRRALTSMAAGARPEIERLSRQALSAPGVEPVIKPEVDALRSRLDRMSRR